MARKRKKPKLPEDEPISAPSTSEPVPKQYPSRLNVKYIAVPASLYAQVKAYADEHSDEDEKKSVSWAARRLLRLGLIHESEAG